MIAYPCWWWWGWGYPHDRGSCLPPHPLHRCPLQTSSPASAVWTQPCQGIPPVRLSLPLPPPHHHHHPHPRLTDGAHLTRQLLLVAAGCWWTVRTLTAPPLTTKCLQMQLAQIQVCVVVRLSPGLPPHSPAVASCHPAGDHSGLRPPSGMSWTHRGPRPPPPTLGVQGGEGRERSHGGSNKKFFLIRNLTPVPLPCPSHH